jgi:hypothetical protein
MSQEYTQRSRLIIYLDAERYSYLQWLAQAKRDRIANIALDLLEKAVDAQQRKAPAPE